MGFSSKASLLATAAEKANHAKKDQGSEQLKRRTPRTFFSAKKGSVEFFP